MTLYSTCRENPECVERCEAGDASACEYLYDVFSRRGDHRRHRALRHLLAIWRRQCPNEDPEACLRLGMVYQAGLSVQRDTAEAERLVQLAVRGLGGRCFEGHNGAACLRYGRVVEAGLLPATPLAAAFRAYELACVLEQVDACEVAAELTREGRGVPKDERRTLDLTMLGANQRRCQPP